MHKRRIVLTPIIWLVCLSGLPASAGTLLYERTVSLNHNPNIFDIDHFDLDLIFGNHQFVPTNKVILFGDLVISPSDVGSIYEATAATDPNFATVAGRVTDALNEYITVSMTEDEPGGLTKQNIIQENMFFGKIISPIPPDLSGNVVDKITLKINSFTLAAPGEVVEGQPVDLVVTISFFGIPEPQTLALLACGLAASLSCFESRKNRN